MKERFETFTVLINRISRNIKKLKNREMAEYNLKSPHISCLYHLYMTDGLTATDLCEKCEEDKATISRSLDFLEKNGYLSCETVGVKRYKSPMRLTEKGRATGEKIAKKIENILSLVGDGLNDDERISLYRSLLIISNRLDRICEDSGVKPIKE